jgi:Uma2 family endonuclease
MTGIRPISVAEYLEGERHDDERNEFVAGEIYSMVGATQAHNTIAGAFRFHLFGHLRGTACRTFAGTMKLRVGDDFYYPDVLVTCDRKDRDDPRFVCYPVLIIEVLSPGTIAWDTRHKLAAYKAIDSLREYVVAEQEKRQVRVHRRTGKSWRTDAYAGAQSLRLASVDLTIPLEEIYRDVVP